MDIEKNKEKALMRHTAIEELLNPQPDDFRTKEEKYRDAAEKVYYVPIGPEGNSFEMRQYSPSTIEKWYRACLNKGFDALYTKTRSDLGQSRVLTAENKETIKYYRSSFPRMNVAVMYRTMLDKNEIDPNKVSYSTVNRYVRTLKVVEQCEETTNKDMHRYERAHINEAWYADTMHGVNIVTEDGKSRKFYVITFIDDASRFIVGADIFFEDNYVNVMSVMHTAIAKYGKPTVLSMDCGAPYKNKQMSILAARLNIDLRYCKPYSPYMKGKIERLNNTISSHWIATIDFKTMHSLQDIRTSFYAWIDKYNSTVHSSIRMTPQDRFFDEVDRIKRISTEALDKAFLLEITRKVSADSVISIDSVLYEVPTRFANQKITIRHSPDMSHVYVVNADDSFTEISKLDKHANAIAKRNKPRLYKGDSNDDENNG